MNIFEIASVNKIRFGTTKGELTTEQLWDLPLQSKGGFDLDSVARSVNSTLRDLAEDSFVTTTTNPAKSTLELKLEIVKHVINAKLAANEDARTRSARSAERDKLVGILSERQDDELKKLTPEQLAERIKALG